jgi:putative DNA primase/helicase
MSGQRDEYAAIMGTVATALYGPHNRRLSSAKEWRWGTNGSLRVDVEQGVWYDHEHQTRGGVLALVVHARQAGNLAAARQWAVDGGYLKAANGHDKPAAKPKRSFNIIAEYDYVDEANQLLYQVVRLEPKAFRQRRPDQDQGWTWKMGEVRRVLYRLPRVIAAIEAGMMIFLVEGEKAVHALERFELVATCAPGGANKWAKQYTDTLAGAHVVILPDNDQPGRDHAATALAKLHRTAASIRILPLPGLPDKGDVFDWVEAGGTAQQLIEWVEALPLQEPSAALLADQEPAIDRIGEGAVAELFVSRYAERMRFCHTTGDWYYWDEIRWKREKTGLAFNFAHQLAKAAAAAESDAVQDKAGKANFAAGVERITRTDRQLAVTADKWDANPWLLGTPGGTVDLKTGILRRPLQADYITKITAIAPADTADCPLWRHYLRQVTRDNQPYIRLLQQWIGYSLTGITAEQALLFASGPGGNGKSVFINMVAGMLADYATTAAMETFISTKNDQHPTEIARLAGARFVSAVETEEGRHWNEVKLKQLTGGDRIAARFMRQDFFEFTPQFKLMIIGNHTPLLHNVNDAMRRRINIAPFDFKPDTPDTDLENKLKAEWPAILRWAIDGCLDWQDNGLMRPEVVRTSTHHYFDEQDLLADWIDNFCQRTNQDGQPTYDAFFNLYASWSGFCKTRNEHPGSSKSFSGRLTQRGLNPIENKFGIRGKGFYGIRVKLDY